MKRKLLAGFLLGLGMAAGIAYAQTNSGAATPPTDTATTPAPGMGAGPGAGMGQGPGAGMGRRGGGPGGGQGGGRMQFDATNTPGWALMTPQERTEHQAKMRSMKTRDECNAYMVEHKVQIATRAAERNVQLRTPRRDPCATMFPQQ
mgnify:FL=1